MSHHTIRLEVYMPTHLAHELERHARDRHLSLDTYLADAIWRLAEHPPTLTPTAVSFQENDMAPATPGTTGVYTGNLAPEGSAFSAGTSFSVTTTDPTVSASVDATGLIVSVVYPTSFVDDPANPFSFTYTASGIVPVPSSSPTSITATVTPSAPPPPVPTPTSITFA